MICFNEQFGLVLAGQLWGELELERLVLSTQSEVLLVLNALQIKANDAALTVLEEGQLYSVQLFLSHLLLEQHYFCLRLLPDPYQAVLDVLAGSHVLHL